MNDPWVDRLSEYVDGELDAPTRAAVEAHLATCADCRATVSALERVVARARRMGYRPPANDLWPDIRSALAPTALPNGNARRRRVVTISFARLAVAAALVAVVAGGLAWTIASRRAPLLTPPVAARTDSARDDVAVAERGATALAMASYRDAAADLERVLEGGRGTLRPETMRVIEANLHAMDLAIAQADSALRRDPASAYLNQHLAETMQRKLKLLRRAVEIATAQS